MEYSRIGEGLHSLENELAKITAFLNHGNNNSDNSIDGKYSHKDSKKPKLKILNFHANRLSSIRDLSIRSSSVLKSLTELNLSSNNFSTWSGLSDLSYLPMLFTLDLSGNCLTSVTSCPYLPSLKHLLLAFNALDNILGVNDNCPNLLQLDIRSNNISTTDALEPMRGLLLLQHLLLGNRNPILAKKSPHTAQIVSAFFDQCSSLITVDNLSREEWKEEEMIYAPTPHYDRIMERFRSGSKLNSYEEDNMTLGVDKSSWSPVKAWKDMSSFSSTITAAHEITNEEVEVNTDVDNHASLIVDNDNHTRSFDNDVEEITAPEELEVHEFQEFQETPEASQVNGVKDFIDVQVAQDLSEISTVRQESEQLQTMETAVQTDSVAVSSLPPIDDSDLDEDIIPQFKAGVTSQEQQTENIPYRHISTDIEGLYCEVMPKSYDLDAVSTLLSRRYLSMECFHLKLNIFTTWKQVYQVGKSWQLMESNRLQQERRQLFDKTSLEAANKRINSLEAQLMASKRSASSWQETVSQLTHTHSQEIQRLNGQFTAQEKELFDLKAAQEIHRNQEIEKIQEAILRERQMQQQSSDAVKRKWEQRLLALQSTCDTMTAHSEQFNKEHESVLNENNQLKSSLLAVKSGVETLKSEIQRLDKEHAVELATVKRSNKDTLSKLLQRLEVAEVGLKSQAVQEQERRARREGCMVSIGINTNTTESIADVELALKVKGKILDDMQSMQEIMKERIKSLEHESSDLRQAYHRLEDENDQLHREIKQLTEQSLTTKDMEQTVLELMDEITADVDYNLSEEEEEEEGNEDDEVDVEDRKSVQRIERFRHKLNQVDISLSVIDSHGTDDEEEEIEMEDDNIDGNARKGRQWFLPSPLVHRKLGCSKQLCAIEKKEVQVELEKQINSHRRLRKTLQHEKQLQGEELALLQKQIEDSQSSIIHLNQLLASNKAQYEDRLGRMDSERKKLGHGIKQLQSELSSKDDELQRTKSAIEKMRRAFNAVSIA